MNVGARRQILETFPPPKKKIHRNPYGRSLCVPHGRTDRQTDMTKGGSLFTAVLRKRPEKMKAAEARMSTHSALTKEGFAIF